MFGIRHMSRGHLEESHTPDALSANVKIAVQKNEQAGMKVQETLRELLEENQTNRALADPTLSLEEALNQMFREKDQ